MSQTVPAVHGSRVDDDAFLSLVYVSDATVTFSEMDLALLLAVSRSNNEPQQVTGLLLHNRGRFMQALEGPAAAVRSTLDRISGDPRHRDVRILEQERIDERRFSSWAMGYRSIAALGAEAAEWFGSPEAMTPRAGSRADELLVRFRDR